MSPKVFRTRLIAAWWSSTCSLLALAMDRRMTTGLAEESVDCAEEYSRALIHFRDDVAVNRLGSRWLLRNRQ
jgi:hypothetical protein